MDQESKKIPEIKSDGSSAQQGSSKACKFIPDQPAEIVRMATNTLANLRACVNEFDMEQSVDILNMSKRFTSWIENFEACAEFEGVSEGIMRPAVLALGGEKFRELCKTLEVSATDDYAALKDKLKIHYTAKKNTSAERFKFLNMKPESR